MPNPTLPTITDAEADVLEATGVDTEFNTNLPYIPEDQAVDGSPQKLHTLYTQLVRNIARFLNIGGKVIRSATGGLNIGVCALEYQIGGTAYSYAGENSVALTDDATNYVHLDGSATVQISTSSFPANVWLLAVVVTAGGAISSITDARPRNAQVGVANDWSAFAAQEDVDLAGFGFEDLGKLDLQDATELTISSGAITPTQMYHTVGGEGDTTDTLTNITAVAGERKFLLLAGKDGVAYQITLSDSGNIDYEDGDPTLGFTSQGHVLLFQYSDTNWRVIAPDRIHLEGLSEHLDFNEAYGLERLGKLAFYRYENTIASGTVDLQVQANCPVSMVSLATESAASTDDLDTATSGVADQLLIMFPTTTGEVVVVKHAIGAGKFLLANGLDFSMSSTEHTLKCRHDGIQWVEVSRSPMDIADLAGTSRAIPYVPGTWFWEGALTASVHPKQIFCKDACTIQGATARVATAPSGGALIVDLQVDGASIYANDGERMNVADGTVQGTNATKDHPVAAGSYLQIQVLNSDGSPNGAEDLTVTPNGRIAPVTPP